MSQGKKSEATIEDIYWGRIFLHIIVNNPENKDIYLRMDKSVIGPLNANYKKVPSEDEKFQDIEINLACINAGTFLDNGKWKIGYFDEAGDFAYLVVAEKLAQKIENLDKIFHYDELEYAYAVSFSIFAIGDGTNMHLILNSFFCMENKKWKKGLLLHGAKRANERCMEFLQVKIAQLAYCAFSLACPGKEKNILIMSEAKEQLDGNLLAIYQRVKERQLDKKYNLSVSTRNMFDETKSHLSWLVTIRKVARAGIIVLDNHAPMLSKIKISKETKLVQIWHAGVGFKSVGFARFGKKGSPLPSSSVHQKYTYALAPSESLIKVYEEVFGIPKDRFIVSGLPRLDGYLDEKRIADFKRSFYETYPELKNKKLILFAPTFRGSGQKTAYYDYEKIDFDKLNESLGEDCAFIVKMHPFTKDKLAYYEERFPKIDIEDIRFKIKPDLKKYSDKIYDLTGKFDINDLFYVTDILITDYSSAYYEFSIHKKPILFYVYDKTIYENIRGVHKKIDEAAPGKVVNTFDELISAIESGDFEIEKTIKFADENFPEPPNGAADKIIDKVILGK